MVDSRDESVKREGKSVGMGLGIGGWGENRAEWRERWKTEPKNGKIK